MSLALRGAIGSAARTCLALATLTSIVVSSVAAGEVSPSRPRIDPRLAVVRGAGVTERIWVTFRDKGPADPASRRRALEDAERALSPRNRARRMRARVSPLVDDYDLPVAPRYLEALRHLGLAPHAVSRWLNRAAVMAGADQIEALARLECVAALGPVSSGRAASAPSIAPAPDRPAAPAGDRRPAVAGTAIDYGRLDASLRQLRVPALHDSGYDGSGVLVCLLDAGFGEHDTHEALRDRFIAPGHRRDFVEGDSTVTDPDAFFFQHGTLVLGALAGNRPGAYVGPAFDADLALGRTEVTPTETPVEMLYWAQGAEWADSLGADVLNSSLGYFQFDEGYPDYTYADMDGHTTDISRAAQIAASKGILAVNSVGNEGVSPWHFLIAPSDVHGDSLVAVGAVNLDGVPAALSSYGPSADGRVKPDLAAHGVSVPVVSTSGDPEGYSFASGTSLSAPLVSGLVACLMEARRDWPPAQIIRALRETASRFRTPDMRVGYGIPNGARALQWPEVLPEVPISGRVGIRLAGPNPYRPEDGDLLLVIAAAADQGPVPARVVVADVSGRVVRELWNGVLGPGARQETIWNGRDAAGRPVGPGLYWISIRSQDDVATRRVALVR